MHPYSSRRAPNANPAKINRDYATFPVLDRVAKALDGVTGAYGSHTRFPIYNDEYGYITSPPQPAGLRYPTPERAAAEINQAEYLSYKNPRVASYAQFLLNDPEISVQHPKPGFSSGLYTSTGEAKATLYAYRLPLWLPKTTVQAGSKTEIWGGARPATYSLSATTPTAPAVELQMRKAGAGPWTTIQTVKVSTSHRVLRDPLDAALQRRATARLHLPADRAVAADSTSPARRSTAARSTSPSPADRHISNPTRERTTSMHTPLKRSTKLRGLLTAAFTLATLATLSLTAASPASASTRQVSILQDTSFLTSPARRCRWRVRSARGRSESRSRGT